LSAFFICFFLPSFLPSFLLLTARQHSINKSF
jgi:hypothetical protein